MTAVRTSSAATLLVCVVLQVAGSGCALNGGGPQDWNIGAIDGRVVNEKTGESVAQAVIVIRADDTVNVAIDGRFKIERLPVGDLYMKASAKGFSKLAGYVHVDIDHVTEVEIRLSDDYPYREGNIVTHYRRPNPMAECSCRKPATPGDRSFLESDAYLDGYLDHDFIFSGWMERQTEDEGWGATGPSQFRYKLGVWRTWKGNVPDTVVVVADASYCHHLLDRGRYLFFLRGPIEPPNQSRPYPELSFESCDTPTPVRNPDDDWLLKRPLMSPPNLLSHWGAPDTRTEFDRWFEKHADTVDDGTITGWVVDADLGTALELKSKKVRLHFSDLDGRKAKGRLRLDDPSEGLFRISGVRPGTYSLTLVDRSTADTLAASALHFLGGSRFVPLRAVR